MSEPVTGLSAWEGFYVIVGSSGGALIGLQFVVITLIADRRANVSMASLSAFGTPVVVHLSAVLFASAVMCAPWPSLTGPSIALAACGIVGAVYGGIVATRARRQHEYRPIAEDWIWYVLLPFLGYAWLAMAALRLPGNPMTAAFGIAAGVVALLFISIRNAWDTVTHVVMTSSGAGD